MTLDLPPVAAAPVMTFWPEIMAIVWAIPALAAEVAATAAAMAVTTQA